MRLTDYVNTSAEMKKRYFDTVSMQVGLRYFGGKAMIGKYLLNRIFEMQAYRYLHDNHNPAETFVDCFTGGGKIALSIPTGWFENIVINDLNYGVYSYYRCCRDNPLALIEMIERLGQIMCFNVFKLCARERSTPGKHLSDDFLEKIGLSREELNKPTDNESNINADMVLSAAMTYWVTQSSWLGETDPDRVSYALNTKGKNEKQEIEKRVQIAKKRILQINSKMLRQNFIIENLDYVELIEKYREKYDESVIWYLDPPYHEATLNKSNGIEEGEDIKEKFKYASKEQKPAPYEDTFLYEQTMAMTYLLATMKWFIKSDYDPSFFFRDPYEEIEDDDVKNDYEPNDHFHDFDIIENLEKGFVREYLGSFHKGTSSGKDEGFEVIWSRYDGSPESCKYLGVTDNDSNWAFWNHKKKTRENWLNIKE